MTRPPRIQPEETSVTDAAPPSACRNGAAVAFSALALLSAWTAPDAMACDACTGNPTNALRTGTQAGILAMLGLICAVLMGVAFVGGYWLVRARRLARQAAAPPSSPLPNAELP